MATRQSWTVQRKVGVGFAATTALSLALVTVAVMVIGNLRSTEEHMVRINSRTLIDAQKVGEAFDDEEDTVRGYLVTGDERFAAHLPADHAKFEAALATLRVLLDSPEEISFAAEIERQEIEYQKLAAEVVALRAANGAGELVARKYRDTVAPRADEMNRIIAGVTADEERLLADAEQSTSDRTRVAVMLLVGLAAFSLACALVTVVLVVRGISRQIGSAIQQVQSSSVELQAAANQQASGTREQSAAAGEVTTTLRELVATSRQMAESSQRVTRIAEDTAASAQAGDLTVQKAQTSINAIKRQVDLIVTHMLDLGKKSQQVGGILEIIDELAEQTNILAINATIESAGAGDAGKRFAVVADEIRRLADRVGGSTREVRALIGEIRSAANTTVMVTEDGMKAVDSGTRQFGEVAASFRQITGLVHTTTDAAREIELGAKQQVTAIEQVNTALRDIAQAAKESEVSTRQTLQTSTELASLSRELALLIERRAAVGAAA